MPRLHECGLPPSVIEWVVVVFRYSHHVSGEVEVPLPFCGRRFGTYFLRACIGHRHRVQPSSISRAEGPLGRAFQTCGCLVYGRRLNRDFETRTEAPMSGGRILFEWLRALLEEELLVC